MIDTKLLRRASMAAALLLAVVPFAHAQINTDQGNDVTSMCAQGLKMPAPYGEGDLKGNSKFLLTASVS